jgi:hypothetical protein
MEQELLEELRRELEKHGQKDDFDEIVDDTFFKKSRSKEIPSEIGDLDIDRYLEGDARCFDEVIRERVVKPALTVVMDMAIPWVDREDHYMVERHKKIYSLVVAAEAECQPCRVVASFAIKTDEQREVVRYYFIIKDYDEPIYPGLWGAFKTNRSTTCMVNAVMDFMNGTNSYGNGQLQRWDVRRDLPEDEEVVLINPRFLRCSG